MDSIIFKDMREKILPKVIYVNNYLSVDFKGISGR